MLRPLKFTDPAYLGPEYWRPVCFIGFQQTAQLFVHLSCHSTWMVECFVHCYYTPPYLICQLSLHSLQLPFISSNLYHTLLSNFAPVNNWCRGYIQRNVLFYWVVERFEFCTAVPRSSTVYIVCSVPQRSVLGLRLFIIYTADLEDVAERHRVTLHVFADDTQLYLHCRHDDMASTAVRRALCPGSQPANVIQSTHVQCWQNWAALGWI